jgi:hypothetical protein
MTDRVFAIAGDWALASDGVQWMLMRRHPRKRGDSWDAVSFVHSTRNILARCMREKGLEPGTAAQLLLGLPNTFDEWKAAQTGPRAVLSPNEARARLDPDEATGLRLRPQKLS